MNAAATIAPVNDLDAAVRDADMSDAGACAEEVREADLREVAVRDAGAQYMRALERANQVRIARAEIKRRVARGTLDAAEIVLACPREVESMAVGDLLTSQRRWGQTRCRKLLAQVPMSERKTIGSMTDRQRQTLAALLSRSARGRDQRKLVAGALGVA
jgi:hypothetical protein